MRPLESRIEAVVVHRRGAIVTRVVRLPEEPLDEDASAWCPRLQPTKKSPWKGRRHQATPPPRTPPRYTPRPHSLCTPRPPPALPGRPRGERTTLLVHLAADHLIGSADAEPWEAELDDGLRIGVRTLRRIASDARSN